MSSTILVVDDNPDNRDVIVRMLRISGFNVVSAVNGSDAIDTARQTVPDLILMDLAMPVMDGWTATRLIRGHPDLGQIPVIALTGHLTLDNLDRARQAGCADHLPKPIDYESLIKKVKHYLTVRHTDANAPL
jgi:CheY-like chemotaxis protein